MKTWGVGGGIEARARAEKGAARVVTGYAGGEDGWKERAGKMICGGSCLSSSHGVDC